MEHEDQRDKGLTDEAIKYAERPSKKRQYTSEPQQMLMRMVEYLAQDILVPKTLNELQTALDISKDQAFRTLWNLIEMKWCEEGAYGYRLSPRLTIIADQLRLSVSDALQKYLPERRKE